MVRLSSSLTLGLAIFVPVFWYVFFGCLTLFFCLTGSDDLPFTNVNYFKLGFLLFFLLFGLIIYYTLMKLKRVELEDQTLYITNYFKTISLHLEQIPKIKDLSILGLIIVTLEVDHKSIFGKKIRFISDRQKFKYLTDRKKTPKGQSLSNVS